MTTKEAMEIYNDPEFRHMSKYRAAVQFMVDVYLAEHDDTPLTLELAKEVLGEPKDAVFTIGGKYAGVWCHTSDTVIFNGYDMKTIGQLRTIARLLRGWV